MVLINTRLYPLGKDYVVPVRWQTDGPIHGVWGRVKRVTCCRVDFSAPRIAFSYLDTPITCQRCLSALRDLGWDV
jgi:hypothetical protein